MYFQLVDEARDWFAPIRKDLEFEFDIYYFCLMMGLASGYKTSLEGGRDLVADFPGGYRSRARLIVAAFLRTELDYRRVDLSDRESLGNELRKLLDPMSSSGLSDEGMKELNQFAKGGLFKLQEVFESGRPTSLQSFLLVYRSELQHIAEHRSAEMAL
jgi:hypothetical protein